MSEKRRLARLTGLAGLGLAVLAFILSGPLAAGAVLLALLSFGPARTRTIGDTPIQGPVEVDAATLRRYRADHAGSTITEAIAATRQ